jgi:large-conductance mechanosensitive channel
MLNGFRPLSQEGDSVDIIVGLPLGMAFTAIVAARVSDNFDAVIRSLPASAIPDRARRAKAAPDSVSKLGDPGLADAEG